MRLWSIHPKYLDVKGLCGLWRESIMARNALLGIRMGYKNHPQLNRFKDCKHPVDAINYYLCFVWQEAALRGYNFDKAKINWDCKKVKLKVTTGQMDYELKHLLKKLKIRDTKKYTEIKSTRELIPHPMFKLVAGGIEDWEIT